MSTLIALIASALLAGAALHALLAGASPGWARGSWFQVALAIVAAVATAIPMLGSGAVAAMLVPAAVAGTNIGNVAESITGTLGSVTKLITLLSYLAGLAFSIAAIFKFKQHKDNPTQAPGTRLAGILMALGGTLGTIFNGADVQALLANVSATA